MKKITLFFVFTFLSLLSFSQTVYQLNHTHNYTWEDNDWLRISETYYDYDNGGVKETNVLNKVSADGISFMDNYRHTKSYNSNNFILEDLKELWNGSTWIDNTKTTTTYNGSDRILQELSQTHNGAIWINSAKLENTYTEDLEENLYYLYENDDWVLYSQSLSTPTDEGYDQEVWTRNYVTQILERDSNTIYAISNSMIDNSIEQTWDETLAIPAWVNTEKIVYTYIPEDEFDITFNTIEYYSWDNSLMDWETEPIYRVSFIRDDATYDIIVLGENNIGGVWEDDYHSLYIYDANGNILSYENQDWDNSLGSNGEWVTIAFIVDTYDTNNNNTQTISQFDFGDGLENSSKVDRFWSEATALSVSFNSLENISLYPNPTTDVINIKFKNPLAYSSEAKLYDIQGKLIHKVTIQKGSGTAKIPIEYQENGIYMLHINTKKAKQTYKIVKSN